MSRGTPDLDRRQLRLHDASRPFANPAWLLLAGFALELVAVVFPVLPRRPLGPLGPLSTVVLGLVLATLGAVGLAREE